MFDFNEIGDAINEDDDILEGDGKEKKKEGSEEDAEDWGLEEDLEDEENM